MLKLHIFKKRINDKDEFSLQKIDELRNKFLSQSEICIKSSKRKYIFRITGTLSNIRNVQATCHLYPRSKYTCRQPERNR